MTPNVAATAGPPAQRSAARAAAGAESILLPGRTCRTPRPSIIQNRLIVCIASAWNYDPTCKHHLMRILSRRNRILWVNYHGTRRPSVLKISDLRHAAHSLGRVASGLCRAAPNIHVVTPMVIPAARHAWTHRLHEGLVIRQIRRSLSRLREFGRWPVQVWTFAPDVPFLVGKFNEERFVYYCVDEYAAFEGHDRERITAAETQLLDRADVAITSSEPLWHAKSRRRPDAHLVRHGVDYDHFAAAWRDQPACPPDLARISRPRMGFFGLIHHWIDHSLLSQVARSRPKYNFVLLGDCRAPVSCLKALPNVHLLGRRPYTALPAYAAHFDAGLLPFVQDEMTPNINPIKMMEYLAAGLPIASTPLPEAMRLGDPVYIGNDAPSFARACDVAVQSARMRPRPDISRIVQHETWEARVALLSRLIQGTPAPAVRGKIGGRAAPILAVGD